MVPGKHNTRFVMLVLAAFVLASCASKPAVAPSPAPSPAPTPEAKPPPTAPAAPAVSQADLDKFLADAQALKKRSFDLKLFEVLPDDYKTAEAAYAAGFAAYQAKDAEPAKTALEKSIALYKDLIDRGVVDLAAAKRKSAEDMRAAALKAGADLKAPTRFGPADESLAAGGAAVEAGKHEEAIAIFERSGISFELAYKRSLASDARERIKDKDLAKWDSGNFQLAENKYAAEDSLWASGKDSDLVAGIDALDEAVLRYNLVVQKGRQSVAIGAKEKTDESKTRSETIKAQVAVKDQYDAALATYEDGISKLTSGDFETAADELQKSGAGFDAAYEAAAAKRASAAEAMRDAQAAAAESEKKAADADPIVNQSATAR